MIPGKRYTPEDVLEIAWRRRWIIVTPFVLVAIGTFLWTQRLPDRYRSTAVVLVSPPQVPVNYVRPTVTESLDRRLAAIRQELLSRPRLEAMIKEFDLYPELRRDRLMEDVVAQMRRDIGVDVPGARRRENPGSFQVSYESENPRTAMLVADRLASLFMRRNSETRVVQADSTTQFLDSQLEAARRKLQDQEQRLAAFRRANAGRLPTDVNSNLQMLKGSQDELQSLAVSITQDRDRQLTIERTIADEIALGHTAAAAPAPAAASPQGEPVTAAGRLRAAEAQLTALSLKLKETHPDIRSLKRRIEELKKLAGEEALQRPVSDGVPVTGTAAELTRQKRIATLRAEHESLERRMASKRDQMSRLQGTIAEYRARLDAAPMLESELSQLTRDYDTLNAAYSTLLLKSQDARVAASLEERQVGEKFTIVESARLPERATSPNRLRLNVMGALAGLALGLALAGALEYKDRSVRTEDDIVLTLALPVLAMVPTMVTRAERAQRRRRRFMLATSGAAVALVALAVVAWKLQVLSAWLQ